jgi:hypothetical protein
MAAFGLKALSISSKVLYVEQKQKFETISNVSTRLSSAIKHNSELIQRTQKVEKDNTSLREKLQTQSDSEEAMSKRLKKSIRQSKSRSDKIIALEASNATLVEDNKDLNRKNDLLVKSKEKLLKQKLSLKTKVDQLEAEKKALEIEAKTKSESDNRFQEFATLFQSAFSKQFRKEFQRSRDTSLELIHRSKDLTSLTNPIIERVKRRLAPSVMESELVELEQFAKFSRGSLKDSLLDTVEEIKSLRENYMLAKLALDDVLNVSSAVKEMEILISTLSIPPYPISSGKMKEIQNFLNFDLDI